MYRPLTPVLSESANEGPDFFGTPQEPASSLTLRSGVSGLLPFSCSSVSFILIFMADPATQPAGESALIVSVAAGPNFERAVKSMRIEVMLYSLLVPVFPGILAWLDGRWWIWVVTAATAGVAVWIAPRLAEWIFRRATVGQKITVDSHAEKMWFEGYAFKPGFWPGSNRKPEEIAFSDVKEVAIRWSRSPVVRNLDLCYIDLVTAHGRVKIWNYMSDVEDIAAVFHVLQEDHPPPSGLRRLFAIQRKDILPFIAMAAVVIILVILWHFDLFGPWP